MQLLELDMNAYLYFYFNCRQFFYVFPNFQFMTIISWKKWSHHLTAMFVCSQYFYIPGIDVQRLFAIRQ